MNTSIDTGRCKKTRKYQAHLIYLNASVCVNFDFNLLKLLSSTHLIDFPIQNLTK